MQAIERNVRCHTLSHLFFHSKFSLQKDSIGLESLQIFEIKCVRCYYLILSTK